MFYARTYVAKHKRELTMSISSLRTLRPGLSFLQPKPHVVIIYDGDNQQASAVLSRLSLLKAYSTSIDHTPRMKGIVSQTSLEYTWKS